MKALIISLSFLSCFVWAGGNGTGTMSVDKGKSSAQAVSKSKNRTAILFYQGETTNDIYFKFGKPQGKDWAIEQFKVNKKTDLLNKVVLDALEKSKSTNNWSRVLPIETGNTIVD